LWSQGRLGLAKRELAQAESDMRKSMGPEHTNTLAIALQRGCLEVLVNLDPEGMNRVKYAARKLIERHHDIDPRTHFDAENGLGQSLLYQGDLAAAYPHLVNALDLSHQLSGTMADGGAPDLNLAWYFQDTGQFARARQLLLDAISRLTQARGANHPLLADLESRVKGLNLAEGIPKSSGIQKSEVRQRPVTAESDPAALMTMGDFNAALPLIDLQLDSVRSMAIGDTYQATRYAAYDLKGRYLAGTGNCESALALYRQALATLQHAHADSPYVMLTHARMGQCLLTLGRRGEALNEWRIASRRVLAQPKLGPQMLKEVRVLQQSLGAF
jgi:tetratricopeptide (TPR) repeat protein